jgi:hypothetical protein
VKSRAIGFLYLLVGLDGPLGSRRRPLHNERSRHISISFAIDKGKPDREAGTQSNRTESKREKRKTKNEVLGFVIRISTFMVRPSVGCAAELRDFGGDT